MGLALLALPTHGASPWVETFANTTPQRTVGSPLDGVAAEVGGVAWGATSGVIFGAGKVVDSGADRTHVGGLAFDPAAYSTGSRATLTGSLDVSGSSWVAIGFTSSPTLPMWAGGEVWMLLRSNGSYVVRADGVQHTVTSGMALDFHPQSLNELTLTFDPGANTVSASVNSHAVAQDLPLPYAPAVSHGGFQLHRTLGGAAGLMAADNLELTVTPPAPPTVSVSGGDVTVSGVTASGDVALLGVVHGRQPWLGTVSPRAETLADNDGDGAVTHSTGDTLEKSLWVAVDVATGRFGVGAADDFEIQAADAPSTVNGSGQLVDQRGSLLLLVVRPSGDVWYGQIHDGAAGDLGADSDGVLDANLGSLSPVGQLTPGAPSPPPLASLGSGDVVVGIDPVHLEYYAFTVDP
ncbi:MAG: hypothetical protein AAGN66_29345 [Acidobacteriota bacterium]